VQHGYNGQLTGGGLQGVIRAHRVLRIARRLLGRDPTHDEITRAYEGEIE
jgi:hypothetical protein